MIDEIVKKSEFVMPNLINLQATPLATTRQVAFQLRRDTSGILNILKSLDSGRSLSRIFSRAGMTIKGIPDFLRNHQLYSMMIVILTRYQFISL